MLIFYGTAFAVLIVLAAVLVLVGRAAGRCPQSANAARIATLVVTTGFLAVGAGAIGLAGVALATLDSGDPIAGLVGLAIALGFGFVWAARRLQEVIAAAPSADGAVLGSLQASAR